MKVLLEQRNGCGLGDTVCVMVVPESEEEVEELRLKNDYSLWGL